MLVNNPTLYNSLYGEKESDIENKDIEWITPTSLNEAEELNRMLEMLDGR